MTQDKVNIFLESDILERYLLDRTTSEENATVDYFLSTSQEVRDTYAELQENLERYAQTYATPPPAELRDRILDSIKGKEQVKRSFPWMAVAASIAAFMFAGLSFMFWSQNEQLWNERQVTNNLIQDLNEDVNSNKYKLAQVESQFLILNKPETSKYVLDGNRRARRFKAVAYVNNLEQKSYVNPVLLPELPDDQVYQMWASVDGKMVPLDILKMSKDQLTEIPYEERMASLQITIEPKGGSKQPTDEDTVANIEF